VEDIIKIYQTDIDKKKITVTLEIPKGTKLKIGSKHFAILWSNLLKNAITYNKEEGTVEINYARKTLSISDSGIGMNETDTKKIFNRFYRVDRTGQTPGSGI
jgi:signal transduction histidine kinase